MQKKGSPELVDLFMTYGGEYFDNIFTEIAIRGDINLIEEMIEKYDCKLSGRLCYVAAFNGNIDLLKWLYNRGCTLESKSFYDSPIFGAMLAKEPARMEILKWLHDIRHLTKESQYIPSMKYDNGITVLEFLLEIGCNLNVKNLLFEATRYNRMDTILWIDKHLKINCTKGVILCSAKFGHLNILEWAINRIDSQCDFSKDAVVGGHLSILQWMKEKGLFNNTTTKLCCVAARSGRLDILEWLLKNGCTWDKRTCDYASEKGHVNFLDYALKNNHEIIIKDCQSEAIKEGQLNVLKFIEDVYRHPNEYTKTFYSLSKRGHLNILYWYCEKRQFNIYQEEKKAIIFAAIKNGYVEIVKFVCGIKGDHMDIDKIDLQFACSCGQLTILKFFYDIQVFTLGMNGQIQKRNMRKRFNKKDQKLLFISAVKGGNKNVADWLINNGCFYSWENITVADSITEGYSEFTKEVFENGCEWGENAFSLLVSKGDIKILVWAKKNGCPFDNNGCPFDNNCYFNAAELRKKSEKYLEITNWLHNNGCYHGIDGMLHSIISHPGPFSKSIALLNWAHDNGYSFKITNMYLNTGHGFEKIYHWLTNNGYDINVDSLDGDCYRLNYINLRKIK